MNPLFADRVDKGVFFVPRSCSRIKLADDPELGRAAHTERGLWIETRCLFRYLRPPESEQTSRTRVAHGGHRSTDNHVPLTLFARTADGKNEKRQLTRGSYSSNGVCAIVELAFRSIECHLGVRCAACAGARCVGMCTHHPFPVGLLSDWVSAAPFGIAPSPPCTIRARRWPRLHVSGAALRMYTDESTA
ncbi:hypothetical protein VTO73DRAFT_8365 [Trametes versicolor]